MHTSFNATLPKRHNQSAIVNITVAEGLEEGHEQSKPGVPEVPKDQVNVSITFRSRDITSFSRVSEVRIADNVPRNDSAK